MSIHTSIDGVIKQTSGSSTSIDGVIHNIKEGYTSVDGVITPIYTSDKPCDYLFDAASGAYTLPKKVFIWEYDSGWLRQYNITTISYTYGGYTCYNITANSNIAVYYTYKGDIERMIYWAISDATKYSKLIVTGYNTSAGKVVVTSSEPNINSGEIYFKDWGQIDSVTVSGSNTYEIDLSSQTGAIYVSMYAHSTGSSNRTFALSQIKLEYK